MAIATTFRDFALVSSALSIEIYIISAYTLQNEIVAL